MLTVKVFKKRQSRKDLFRWVSEFEYALYCIQFVCYMFSGVTLFSCSSSQSIENISSTSIENYDGHSTAAVQCTGQAQILIKVLILPHSLLF